MPCWYTEAYTIYYNPERIDCVSPSSSLVATDAPPTFRLTSSEMSTLDTECYTQPNGMDYYGHVSTTRLGHACQSWSVQTPHAHRFTSYAYPHARLAGDHNFCRNPNGAEAMPWCFTLSEETRWAYCDVPPSRPSCPSRLHLEGNASMSSGDTGTLTLTNGERQLGWYEDTW